VCLGLGFEGQQAAQWVRGEGWGAAHLSTAEMSFAAHLDRSPKGVGVRESDKRHSPASTPPPRRELRRRLRAAGVAVWVWVWAGEASAVRTPRLGAVDCAQAQARGHALSPRWWGSPVSRGKAVSKREDRPVPARLLLGDSQHFGLRRGCVEEPRWRGDARGKAVANTMGACIKRHATMWLPRTRGLTRQISFYGHPSLALRTKQGQHRSLRRGRRSRKDQRRHGGRLIYG
jgi:hypothetical protein